MFPLSPVHHMHREKLIYEYSTHFYTYQYPINVYICMCNNLLAETGAEEECGSTGERQGLRHSPIGRLWVSTQSN